MPTNDDNLNTSPAPPQPTDTNQNVNDVKISDANPQDFLHDSSNIQLLQNNTTNSDNLNPPPDIPDMQTINDDNPNPQPDNPMPDDDYRCNVKRMYEEYKQNYNPRPIPNRFPKSFTFFTVSVFIITIVFGLYCIISDSSKGSLNNNTSNSAYLNQTQYVLPTQHKPADVNEKYQNDDGSYTTEGVSQLVMPSVVEIFTYSGQENSFYNTPLGSGSGIILSTDGYIVTNAHVLEDAGSFSVILNDNSEYSGSIVGKDTKTDIAVIKINADNLPAAAFGNSDDVIIGEQVMAVGNPAGLTGSVTDGIVSGVNRKIKTDATGFEMNCIQTNAAISPGNSGGALVNMFGQVIGITSSKYVNSSYEGLGFAITINEAKPIIEELISQGYVANRVKIGISFMSLNSDYAVASFEDTLGITAPDNISGIWINQIDPDCDIANTSLAVNDVIISVNNTDVYDYDTLYSTIKGKTPDDLMTAKVKRYSSNGSVQEFEIQFHPVADTSGNY